MKNILFLILLCLTHTTACIFGCYIQAVKYRNITPINAIIKPDTSRIDRFTIIRGSENGRDIVYSVGWKDAPSLNLQRQQGLKPTDSIEMGYDFLSLRELDSVLAGYNIDYND